MTIRTTRTLWTAIMLLLLPLASGALAETTLLFTGNTQGEHSPCPT